MLMEHQVIQFWAPPRLFNTLANHVFQSAIYRTIVQTNGEWKITWLSRDGKDENSKCDPFVSMPHPWSRYCTHIRKFNIIRLQRRTPHWNLLRGSTHHRCRCILTIAIPKIQTPVQRACGCKWYRSRFDSICRMLIPSDFAPSGCLRWPFSASSLVTYPPSSPVVLPSACFFFPLFFALLHRLTHTHGHNLNIQTPKEYWGTLRTTKVSFRMWHPRQCPLQWR